jgi:hypothetical protein
MFEADSIPLFYQIATLLVHAGYMRGQYDEIGPIFPGRGNQDLDPGMLADVTTTSPSEVAPTPEEFIRRLEDFGALQRQRHGLEIETTA